MISCSYNGRLGNNMFQIAAAASWACRKNDKCYLRAWPPYEDAFNIKSFDFIKFSSRTDFGMYHEKHFHYEEIPPNLSRGLLCGFFQSYKYVQENICRSLFTLKDIHLSFIQEKYGAILDKKTVSMHIRRGDYLGPGGDTSQSGFFNLGLDYYMEALRIIEEKHKIDKILVFSDDIDFCKEEFVDERCVFIHEEDYIDMAIMSMCDHNIIANSSFSWWGAFLNKNEDKIVVAPKLWFKNRDDIDMSDLYCEDWIKIWLR